MNDNIETTETGVKISLTKPIENKHSATPIDEIPYLVDDSSKFLRKNVLNLFKSDHTIEAVGSVNGRLASSHGNGFHDAVYMAYAYHLPLRFGPKHIEIAIKQALACYVNMDAEKHRSKLVRHQDGKQVIRIYRNQFIKGNPNNDWENTFPEFVSKMGEHMTEPALKGLTYQFTDSDSVSNTVSSLALMDICNKFFDYRCTTLCHIPTIHIDGMPEDWEKLISLANFIKETFDELKWWTPNLIAVLHQFLAASKKNNPDFGFWRRMYKHDDSSGGPYINGWISVFFPYYNGKKNLYAANHDMEVRPFSGMTSDNFGTGLNMVNFIWEYYWDDIPMVFVGGFMGVDINSDATITPALNWAVLEKKR